MPNTSKTSGNKGQGGSKAQHAEAGKQSHKNTASKDTGSSTSSSKK